MAKETIDVEKVVEWAYRIQCVDRQLGGPDNTPSVVSISGGLGEYVRLGTRVDNSGAATRALGLRLPGDATIVHDAVLSLGDVYLEWRARDVVEVWDARLASEKGMAIVPKGKYLAIAPAYEVGEETQPAPLEVISAAVLVILNGRTGSRPDWYPDWRPGSRYTVEPDRREVMLARATYLAWWLSLCRLAERLSRSLSDFDVTGPEAPEAPWKAHRPNIVEDLTTNLPRVSRKGADKRRRRA
ncbi:MAG: hypothetical protein H6R00_187 [Proteobacteria bacterium]|nr:hypothetical protein [Pseudomonadota bacterium]